MKRILLINTGGTFSSRPGNHGLAPEIKSEEIASVLGNLDESVEFEFEDYCSLDSANISPEDWCGLAKQAGKAVGTHDGVVIIHGTDTMAYTSSMLSFMLQNIPIPVVLTGSQLPIGVPMSDAVDNCRCAIQMAASGIGGVYVAFDRKIMLGCRTSKVRTLSFNAFESINFPYIGEVNALGLNIFERPEEKKKLFQIQTAYSTKIAAIKLFPGVSSDIFRVLQEYGCEGIFIEGFGLGGVPFLKSDLIAEIHRASDMGMPILVGSQCRYEGSNLNIYETGRRILDCGGIPVHDMTSEAVVTKLMWCLGQSKKRDDIEAMFGKNFVHEVTIL